MNSVLKYISMLPVHDERIRDLLILRHEIGYFMWILVKTFYNITLQLNKEFISSFMNLFLCEFV